MTPGLPSLRYMTALFVVSAAMLAFEVLLLRLFEFSHWHHFAGLSVSLALLGLGAAGTCLALWGRKPSGDGWLLAGIAIQATGTLLVLWLHSRVALRPLFAAWDTGELARLLWVDFAAFVPFFGAGLVIGSLFLRWPAAAGPVYAANLMGSGAGSLMATAALTTWQVEQVLAATILPPVLCLLVLGNRWLRTAGVLIGAAGVAAVLSPPVPLVSDFKALAQVMELPDARLLASRPGLPGRLSVVRSDSLRHAPGLSLSWTTPVPPTDALIIGSDRRVPMPRAWPAEADHMRASLAGLPFALRPAGPVAVLGASEWQSPVATAGRDLVWVEADRRLLDTAWRRGLREATLVADSGFRYLAVTERRFSLILLDAAYAGGDAAGEDYLMTVEGFALVLSRLEEDGLLALPLELSVPPRRVPRAVATLREALEQHGIRQPGRHVAILRGLQDIVLLASPQPLSAADRQAIRAFAGQWRFDPVWLPDIRETETNRVHRLYEPLFYRAASALFDYGTPPEATMLFHGAPAGFQRPYFWRSLSWSRIPDFLASMGTAQALSYLDWTLVLGAATAVLATMLAFVLILVPLGRLPPLGQGRRGGYVAGYFAALGIGYMLLELALFQRAVLFLDEPVLTAALVFTVFLVASGLGSMGAPRSPGRRVVLRIFTLIGAGLAVVLAAFWPLSGSLLALPHWPRLAALAAAMMPLAWALGRAFPWGLSQLAGSGRWVPWAWGINGFASVTAAAIATLVSVQWGQGVTIGAGVLCYILAARIALHWSRERLQPDDRGARPG